MINQLTNETMISAIRQSEYGDFYLFVNDGTNEMIYGSNFIGHIEANAWGTAFDIYNNGIHEKAFKALPKYICDLRIKIVYFFLTSIYL